MLPTCWSSCHSSSTAVVSLTPNCRNSLWEDKVKLTVSHHEIIVKGLRFPLCVCILGVGGRGDEWRSRDESLVMRCLGHQKIKLQPLVWTCDLFLALTVNFWPLGSDEYDKLHVGGQEEGEYVCVWWWCCGCCYISVDNCVCVGEGKELNVPVVERRGPTWGLAGRSGMGDGEPRNTDRLSQCLPSSSFTITSTSLSPSTAPVKTTTTTTPSFPHSSRSTDLSEFKLSVTAVHCSWQVLPSDLIKCVAAKCLKDDFSYHAFFALRVAFKGWQ